MTTNNLMKMDNVFIATGRLTKDASIGKTKADKAFAKFVLASDKKRARKHEESQANFFPVEIYGDERVAICEESLTKGSSVAVVGSVRTESYKNSEGKTVHTWKVIADKCVPLPGGSMTGMNSIVFTGVLQSDCKTAYTKGTEPVCVLDLFIKCLRSKSNGADFLPTALYGKLGESLGRYLVENQPVTVRGRVDTGSYKNSEGATVFTWKVIADDIYLNGSPVEGAKEEPKLSEAPAPTEAEEEADSGIDEESGFIDLPPEIDDGYFEF